MGVANISFICFVKAPSFSFEVLGSRMSSTRGVDSGDVSGNSATTPRPVIVSPPVGDSGQVSERHEDVTRTLFDEQVNVNDIPSQHKCPLAQEPNHWKIIFKIYPISDHFWMYNLGNSHASNRYI